MVKMYVRMEAFGFKCGVIFDTNLSKLCQTFLQSDDDFEVFLLHLVSWFIEDKQKKNGNVPSLHKSIYSKTEHGWISVNSRIVTQNMIFRKTIHLLLKSIC